MKPPTLKRTIRTIEVVTWTFEYEDEAQGAAAPQPDGTPSPEAPASGEPGDPGEPSTPQPDDPPTNS